MCVFLIFDNPYCINYEASGKNLSALYSRWSDLADWEFIKIYIFF